MELKIAFNSICSRTFINSAVAFHQCLMREERSTLAEASDFHHAEEVIVPRNFRSRALRRGVAEAV
jgi:hypothetical protein